MKINIIDNGFQISEEEIQKYIARQKEKYSDREVEGLDLELFEDGEIGIRTHLKPIPFQRIRRITGYLVGDVSRFNDAKTKEVEDRVKHGV